jgi:hypothetical protein
MKGRDLKVSLGPFSVEVLQLIRTVKPGDVCLFDVVLNKRKATLIVANRSDLFRVMVLYADGGVLHLGD